VVEMMEIESEMPPKSKKSKVKVPINED